MNKLMHKWSLWMFAGTLTWALSGAALAADEPSDAAKDRDAQHSGMHRERVVRQLSKLDQGQVYGNNGEKIGHIKGLAIDANRRFIAYAVVEFDNFANLADKQFAVPWKSIDKKLDDKDFSKITFAINADREKLKNAKGFDRNKWPDMAELKASEAYAFWNVKPYWESEMFVHTEVTKVEIKSADQDKVKETVRIRGTPVSPEDELIVRAADLVGHKVMDNTEGREFADLYDAMTDVHSGRIVYGIIQVDKMPDFQKDYLHPVPGELIHIEPTGKDTAGHVAQDRKAFKVMLHAKIDQIKDGPKFPEREWPNMTPSWGEQVYAAYGVTPAWKEMRKNREAR